MSEFERLTGANHKEIGFYTYDGPQNPYEVPLTLGELALTEVGLKYSPRRILQEVFGRLAEYEDSKLSPSEVAELAKAKAEGILVILPSKSDEIIRIVELALRIKLYDWQKAYITGVSGYLMPGRASGKTTAYMIKLCLSDGEPIDLTKGKEIERYIDEICGSHYFDWFKRELWNIYAELKRVGGLKLRKIYFSERDKHE